MQIFRSSFLFLGKAFLFLMAYYFFLRLVFLSYYYQKLSIIETNFFEIIQTFISALSIDVATVSYILGLSLPLLVLYMIFKKPFLMSTVRWFIWGMMLFSLSMYIAELGVYGEWEEKPGFEVLTYLQHPDEIISSNPLGATIILAIFLIFVIIITFKLALRILQLTINSEQALFSKIAVTLSFFFVALTILIIGARGGIGHVPITQSDAYFSKHKILNDAAINTLYNFLHSIIWNQQLIGGQNPFISKLPQNEKETILAKLIQQKSSGNFPKILTTTRPNVVIVILESWSGDFTDNDPKYQGVTPYFHEMAKDGILFTKAYGSGTLSHEGVPAILSAWPAINNLYITNVPSKISKLPSIGKSLKDVGYETLFLYGGQLRYGNMTSYIYANKFDHIYEEKDFPSDTARSTLGVHDEFAFSKFYKHIKPLKEPFLASIFTASSHSPYAQPMEDKIHWGDYHKPFLNSVFYTDRSIKEFMTKMKQESFYNNTLFVFIADHSHITPRNYNRNQSQWHHTAMLLYGNVIKKAFRGKKVKKIVSQHDLASTLLAQMDVKHDDFIWSRNIFRKDYQENAYYTVKHGHGFVTPKGTYTYHIKDKRVMTDSLPKDAKEERKFGEVYMEKLMQSFLDK
ncbi:MAG: sulfatase-like hydrolase/transferase [Thiovulaceae bacterium]|nr:sulfatase-like hydrolase/transferase [Sulfurimonadaceae bacterium]